MVAKDRTKTKDYVLKLAREQGVKFIRLWFTDILGFLKSFSINSEELETAMELGSGFDSSSIQGFARIDESDMVALPDPTTFKILPWRPHEHKTARMFCNTCWPEGQHFECGPRYMLKRNLKRAADMVAYRITIKVMSISLTGGKYGSNEGRNTQVC